jgi:hypothetical protein
MEWQPWCFSELVHCPHGTECFSELMHHLF